MTSDAATDTDDPFEPFHIAIDRAIADLARARSALGDAALDIAVVMKAQLVARLADGEMIVELLADIEDDGSLEDVRVSAYRPDGIRPGEVGDVVLYPPAPDADETASLLHEAAERFHELAKSSAEDRPDHDELALALAALVHGDAPVGQVKVALATALPWVAFLPERDRERFIAEAADSVRACSSRGTFTEFADLIEQWRNTAEIWADPALAASLAAEASEPVRDDDDDDESVAGQLVSSIAQVPAAPQCEHGFHHPRGVPHSCDFCADGRCQGEEPDPGQ